MHESLCLCMCMCMCACLLVPLERMEGTYRSHTVIFVREISSVSLWIAYCKNCFHLLFLEVWGSQVFIFCESFGAPKKKFYKNNNIYDAFTTISRTIDPI